MHLSQNGTIGCECVGGVSQSFCRLAAPHVLNCSVSKSLWGLADHPRYCGWTNSCTTLKLRETMVCWYLQVNRIIPGFLRWCVWWTSSIHRTLSCGSGGLAQSQGALWRLELNQQGRFGQMRHLRVVDDLLGHLQRNRRSREGVCLRQPKP